MFRDFNTNCCCCNVHLGKLFSDSHSLVWDATVGDVLNMFLMGCRCGKFVVNFLHVHKVLLVVSYFQMLF